MIKKTLYLLSLFLAVAQVLSTITGLFDLRALLVSHTMLILSVTVLDIARTKRKSLKVGLSLSALLPLIILVWYLVNLERILTRMPMVNPISSFELSLGLIAIGMILFGALISTGWPLVVLTSFFLLYASFLGPYMPDILASRTIPLAELIDYVFMCDGGIFGTPIYVSAIYVYLFILFGAFLTVSGGGKIFTDLAFLTFGKSVGGPAKASVISSALFGTVSGSAVANVVMTGTFTIPLMKKAGYRPSMAGAVETVASTGGQLMPPVMGAAAFLMAYILGISYWSVALAAMLPAILYYAMLFLCVDLEARKYQIGKTIEIPKFREVLASIYLLLPFFVIIEALALFYDVPSAAYMAFLSILSIWCLQGLKKIKEAVSVLVFIFFLIALYLRIDLLVVTIPVVLAFIVIGLFSRYIKIVDVLESFLETTKSMGAVAMSCASAGLIVGVLMLTGLSLRFTGILTSLAGGNFFVLLILVSISAYILGMGMPTTAVYITVAIILTPALIQLGTPPLVAHMFAFYTAMLSMITPPIALAAYAAAGIADEDPMKVGFTAMRLGFPLFFLPFIFVFKPALLLIGTPIDIVLIFINVFISLFPLAIGFIGYSIRPIPPLERIIYIVSGFLILLPEIYSSLIGGATFTALLLLDRARSKSSLHNSSNIKGNHTG